MKRPSLCAMAVLLAVTRAHAAGAVTGTVGEDVTPPSLKSHPAPTYPAEALGDRAAGTVVLDVTIDAEGRVTDARAAQPVGHGLDDAAIAAVRQWTFAPARRGGVAIPSSLELSLPFEPPAAAADSATGTASPVAPAPASRGSAEPTPDAQTILVLGARPEHNRSTAASQSSTSQDELSLRPRYRLEDSLEAVPGLFSVEHSGGGKAHQYFLRGFDADHGTDIAFSVDGAPVNLPSHAHGQGFSDLHFVIPETIAAIDASKGPYLARQGDFATAGSVDLRLADHVAESFAKAEVGPWGHTRLVALESPTLGPDWRMLAAAEVYRDNGPFLHPDDFNRFSGYLKTTHALDDVSEASLTLLAYGGSWNASGPLPARAVCGEGDGTPTPAAYAGAHCVSRWDSLDPSQGGDTQRLEAIAAYRRRFGERTELDAKAYAVRYVFTLFPNDGIAAPFQPDGAIYGSQIEQDDARTVVGTDARVVTRTKLGGIDLTQSFGLQARNDGIHAELHRTQARRRLDGVDPVNIPGPIADSDIDETALGFYAEEDLRPARWLRFVLGARADRVDVTVGSESPTAADKVSGTRGASLFSPKASAIVSPARWVDVFANYGRGFHSNDARTIVAGGGATLLAPATGYEVGTTLRPVPGLSFGAAAFLLDLASELTLDGDTASTVPSGPTRRYGAELTGRYSLGESLFADAAFTVTHARFTDQADIAAGQAYVPLAPIRTFAAGVGARRRVGPVTLLGSVRVKSMSDRYATADGSLVATGFTLFDAEVGARWRFVELGVEALNLGDAAWREGQFAVQSRLPGEGASPPVGVSFTPGIPRTVLGYATLYW